MYDLIFYLELGLFHVLDWGAIDHMLFLCALTVVYNFKDFKTVFWIVTFFTFGHTFSLILSAFDLFKPPAQLIEFLIPATIILTSIYNIVKYKKCSHNNKILQNHVDWIASKLHTYNVLKWLYIYA